jgi:ataxia telangiectasia mutated family protein
LAFSTGRSSASSGRRAATQQVTGQIVSSVATDYLSCLNTLLATPHAPVHDRAKEVSELALQILQIRHAKQGSLHQVAFACINSVLTHISTDDITLGKWITREVMPLIAHCWPARAILRDAMSNTIREEILKTLYAVHLFLDSLTREPSGEFLLKDLEELLDVLWSEYSKREDRSRLLLDDLTFTALKLPKDHPRTGIFSLRPYNQAAEQNWALMEILSVLETLHVRNSRRNQPQQTVEDDDQPRKRRRTAGDSTGVLQKVTSLDPGVRLTALQLLPFIVQQRRLTAEEVAEILDTLSSVISDKHPLVASWALLACARYVVSVSLVDEVQATNLSFQHCRSGSWAKR